MRQHRATGFLGTGRANGLDPEENARVLRATGSLWAPRNPWRRGVTDVPETGPEGAPVDNMAKGIDCDEVRETPGHLVDVNADGMTKGEPGNSRAVGCDRAYHFAAVDAGRENVRLGNDVAVFPDRWIRMMHGRFPAKPRCPPHRFGSAAARPTASAFSFGSIARAHHSMRGNRCPCGRNGPPGQRNGQTTRSILIWSCHGWNVGPDEGFSPGTTT